MIHNGTVELRAGTYIFVELVCLRFRQSCLAKPRPRELAVLTIHCASKSLSLFDYPLLHLLILLQCTRQPCELASSLQPDASAHLDHFLNGSYLFLALSA